MAEINQNRVKLPRRLSSQDASFIYGESRNGPLHIGSINIFDGRIDYDDLVAHMGARMHLLPRYRQKLGFVPLNLAHATLDDDPDFDLHNHIRRISLPDGADERTLLNSAMIEFAPMLDRSRPLWEMILFDGLEDGRSAVLWKVHHCLVDGVSGMELLTVSLDLRADAPQPEPPSKPFVAEASPSSWRQLANGAIDLLQNGLERGREISQMLESPGQTAGKAATIAGISGRMMQMFARPIVSAPWNRALVTAQRSLAYFKAPFADLRAIRNSFGGSVNDVVLALLSEAAARYLQHHEFRGGTDPLRIGCPVNVRRESESGALGNRVSMMFPELPSTPLPIAERMRAVRIETSRIKAADEPQALDLMLSSAEAIPPVVIGMTSAIVTNALDATVYLGNIVPGLARMNLLPAPGINFIATNVPGAQVPLYLAGRRMTDMIGCVPLGANLGYNVAIVSYNHHLFFGMMAEPRLMPDVELMRDLVAEVFAEMQTLARRAEEQITGGSRDSAA